VTRRSPARRRTKLPDERGETLIELLVTVAIMGVAVVTILGAVGTFVSLTDMHRKQAKAGAYVREYADALESVVSAYPTGYKDCGDKTYYAGQITTPGDISPYTVAVTDVQYATTVTGGWSATCPSPDTGVQRVTLSVSSPDKRATETLVVILRKPCRNTTATSDVPADTACS
jgi:type II secretory pathway pseudopilin PulG